MECILSGSTEENNKYTQITLGIIEAYTGKTVKTLEANRGACKEQRMSGTSLPGRALSTIQSLAPNSSMSPVTKVIIISSNFKKLNELFSWSRSLYASKPFHKWQRGKRSRYRLKSAGTGPSRDPALLAAVRENCMEDPLSPRGLTPQPNHSGRRAHDSPFAVYLTGIRTKTLFLDT